MKEKLKNFCKDIGIKYVGIAPKGPYEELRELFINRIKNGHYSSFEEINVERRINPSLEFDKVESLIVCLFPYYRGFEENANISNYTYGLDYHIAAREKLIGIGEYLSDEIEGFEYKVHVDTGPLPDRYLASKAGLGFYGVNSHIINEEYGSYVFIGYILCNYPFESDIPQDRTCIKCGSCVKACPGGAILGDFNINPHRCKSYLTQKKGDLDEKEIEIIGKSKLVFGCDICQRVCPHNRGIKDTDLEEFKANLIFKLSFDEIEKLSNKEFKRIYGNRAFSWRGKSIILRNFDYIRKNEQE